jgi:hypothetical protein
MISELWLVDERSYREGYSKWMNEVQTNQIAIPLLFNPNKIRYL